MSATLPTVTDPDGMCPACRSGEAIRQTSRTPGVEAFSCDRCDTRWAISVVNPPSLVARIASAMAARSIADEVITVAPDPRAKAAQDDHDQPRGYYIGGCGHRVPLVGAAPGSGARAQALADRWRYRCHRRCGAEHVVGWAKLQAAAARVAARERAADRVILLPGDLRD